MLDPVVVEVAQMRPGVCALCRTHVGPFVDTRVDVAVVGRVYVCVRTCGGQIASLAGFVSAGDLAERDQQLDDAVAEVADLEAALDRAEEQKVVPVGELLQMIAAQRDAVSQDSSPVTYSQAARLSGTCTAIKKNGEPCTAAALPGRDTCVAHSRVAA